MKLLVTGGAGFIGSNFILYWLKKYPEDEVINLDKLTYAGNTANLKTISGLPNYHFVKGDIVDRHVVDQVMIGVDTVIHFAAETHVDRSIMDPSDFIKTNIEGTYVLCRSALKNKVKRFHHISTDEVFGSLSLEDTGKFDEKTSYQPRSPYAASKASSDHLVRAFFHTYGLPVSLSNCSNNYGPYQHPEKLIPLAITNLIEGKKVPVYGDGKNIRDWLYVEDHCRAIERILTDGKVGETYCVGGLTEDISNRDVIDLIVTDMGKSRDQIRFVEDRKGHDRKYAIDWTKIKTELDWRPRYSFEEWLTQTIKWYEEHEDWWRPLKKGSFETYYQKQYKSL